MPLIDKNQDIYPSGPDHNVFGMNLKLYSTKPTGIYDCLILNHFNNEVATVRDYEGRELLELLQNVDDAGADSVKIVLHGNMLTIANNGDRPFSINGYASIMRPFQSPKDGDDSKMRYIGCKGLGFRSVLNWTSTLSIKSLLRPGADRAIICRFSADIADRFYDDITKKWGVIDEAFNEKLLKIAAKKGRQTPVPILSIPEVSVEMATPGITTEVSLQLNNESILGNVREKLGELNRSQFYLFLHHLRHITIDIEGELTTIDCTPSHDAFGYTMEIAISGSKTTSQKWAIEKFDDGLISTAAARRIDYAATSEAHHDYLFHSFFPTRMRLGYGCVLHATVELDQSRNRVLNTPQKVFERLGEIIIRLAQRLTKTYAVTPRWDAYDVVRCTINHSGQKEFGDFYSYLEYARQCLQLCPTVYGSYISYNKSLVVSEKFSELVENIAEGSNEELKPLAKYDVFNLLLLKGFSIMGIGKGDANLVCDGLKSLAKTRFPISQRAAIIAELAREARCNPSFQKLPLLIDTTGNNISGTGYVLTGNKRTLPSILKLSIIDHQLVSSLKNILGEEAAEADSDEKVAERRLVHFLQSLCCISYTDFSAIKQNLYSASRQIGTVEQAVELVAYLYEQWINPDDGERSSRGELNLPKNGILYLPDVNMQPRQICNLIYGETTGDYACAITDWGAELNLQTDEEKESLRDFIVNKLGMAEAVPMLYRDRADVPGYIKNCKTTELKEACYSDIPLEKRLTFIFDKNFINNIYPEDLVLKLLSDKRAMEAIAPQNEPYFLWYSYYSLKYEIPSKTPAAYQLMKPLKALCGYMIDLREWSGDELISAEEFTPEEYENFVRLATAMDAHQSYKSLNISETYKYIENQQRKVHSEWYHNYKMHLKEDFSEKDVDAGRPKNLHVFYTLDGQLGEDKCLASECYYTDNNVPRSLRKHIKLFDIGRREGADLVSRVFGVRKVSDIQTIPVRDSAIILRDLSDSINSLIESRLKILLACRCENIPLTGKWEAQAKTYLSALRKLELTICSNLDFRYSLSANEHPRTGVLETCDYIRDHSETDKNAYWLVLDECNFSKNNLAVDTVACVICDVLLVEGKNWSREFFNILTYDEETMLMRIRQDYSSDLLSRVEALIAGTVPNAIEKKVKIQYCALNQLRESVGLMQINELYRQMCSFPDQQAEFFVDMQQEREKVDSQIRLLFNRFRSVAIDLSHLEELILNEFKLSRDSILGLHSPSILAEYRQWFSNTISPDWSNYILQRDYPDIYSLAFFPNNLTRIQAMWENIEKENLSNATLAEIAFENKKEVVLELAEDSVKLCKIPDPDGTPTKLTNKHGNANTRIRKGKENSARTGQEAEQGVFNYLKQQGYNPFGKSSNLCDSITDVNHYDIEYVDNHGKTHFVEVKSTSDGIIHLSREEYAFAKENSDKYDLYIVRDGKLTIHEKAFNLLKSIVSAEGYIFEMK